MNKRIMTLPTDSKERKEHPLLSGCIRYFPAALAGIAKTSKLGNDKHNPGEPLHHARGKSTDHGDCILRHLMDVQDLLTALTSEDSNVKIEDVLLEVNQMAWRALAYSQELHEKLGAPLAPGAKEPSEPINKELGDLLYSDLEALDSEMEKISGVRTFFRNPSKKNQE